MDFDAFLNDEKTQSAVIMQLALIGELAKRVSDPTKALIAVPSRAIAGFRDRQSTITTGSTFRSPGARFSTISNR